METTTFLTVIITLVVAVSLTNLYLTIYWRLKSRKKKIQEIEINPVKVNPQKFHPYLPLSIKVINTNPEERSNVKLFDISNQLHSEKWIDGNYVDDGIEISSGLKNISYKEILSKLAHGKLTIGLTLYNSATANQILNPINIRNKGINGNEFTVPMPVAIDPYQFQSCVLKIDHEYEISIDGFLEISTLYANATVVLSVYPADENPKIADSKKWFSGNEVDLSHKPKKKSLISKIIGFFKKEKK